MIEPNPIRVALNDTIKALAHVAEVVNKLDERIIQLEKRVYELEKR